MARRDHIERQTAGDLLSHRIFVLSLLGKGILGAVQLLTAAAVALGVSEKLPAIARWLVRAELAEDPNDFIASRIVALTDHLPGSQTTFYAIYFAAHGLLHVGLVVALLKGLHWAYPAAVAVLAALVAYQLIEWFSTGSVVLLMLSALDLLVIYLTIHEWRIRYNW